MNSITENSTPVLVIVRGLPGGGKSYVAREVQKQMGADVVLLDPDATDYKSQQYLDFSAALTAEGVDEKLHPYRFLRSRAYQGAVDGKVIIWNQAFTNQDLVDRTIKNIQAYATEHGTELKALIVEVEIDLDTAKQRVHERAAAGGHDVTDETFERFFNDYAPLEGYDYPVVSLFGTGDAGESAAKIKAAVEKLRA